ncbi:MAG: hypothetical protein OES09_08630 [Gammaproteobacteria bacterium]|nr:hypothetical protein [Gammaproteobacteria bacterium]
MDTRVGVILRSAAILAAFVMAGPLAAEGVQSEVLDLRLSDGDLGLTESHRRCFLKQQCGGPDHWSRARGAPVAKAPRMSLPLGTYGPATFNFNGSRVRMNVSF